MEKKRFFATSDVARICRHSRETVKRWVQEGRLKGYRVGKSGFKRGNISLVDGGLDTAQFSHKTRKRKGVRLSSEVIYSHE